MTDAERRRTKAALDTFTGNGKYSSGYTRNDIRDLMTALMSIAAEAAIDVPRLTNAALKVYGETHGVNV